MPAALVAAVPALPFNSMKVLFSILLLNAFCIYTTYGQQKEVAPDKPETSTLNHVDTKGRKHGMWLISKQPRMGEAGTNEFGNYEHGIKYGAWYKIDQNGDLVSVEHFRNDVLDGEVKYYDRGKLYCIGHYRGLNPQNKFDTIVVMHPVTHVEEYRIISTDNGSLRHGSWKYYDADNGSLVKEEEYQVDELIFKKDYVQSASKDSINRKKHEAMMPHNQEKKAVPPRNKKLSYMEN